MNPVEDVRNDLLVEVRKELDDWRNRRWVWIVVGVLLCAAYLIPGGTAPLTVKGSLLGLGLVSVFYGTKNWRGDPKLRLLLEVKRQLDQHLEGQCARSETAT